MRKILQLLALLGAFLTPAYAQFTFTSLQFPGGDLTRTFGISNRKEIVGSYRVVPPRHALLIAKGQFLPLAQSSVLGTNFSEARGNNDRGQVVGMYLDDQGNQHGFLLSRGVLTAIDFPGAAATEASGINDSGTIVGWFFDAAGAVHGFVLRAGVFTEIHFPGAADTQPIGINSRGDISGSWDTNINTQGHGFIVTKAGQFINIDAPAAAPDSTSVTGINDLGQIVGSYTDASGVGHGFLATGGDFKTVDFPAADFTICWGINNAGQIVGNYNAGTLRAGFSATPTH